MKKRNGRIKAVDYLKTIAIIGVFLYHSGAVKNGYLGVEVFFVVSGFLLVQELNRDISSNSFRPIKYIFKRVVNFGPLILFSGLVSMAVGYFCMLPDDYENLSESLFASVFYANNILQSITTKNYWDIVNTYKPLMHTWYIAVLIQCVTFISAVLWGIKKILPKIPVRNVLFFLTLISLIMYCLPVFSYSDKFYHFPFRLFELTIGCLIPFIPKNQLHSRVTIGNLGIMVIFFFLFSNINVSVTAGIIIVIISSCIVVWSHGNEDEDYGINEKIYSIITVPGRYSFDIYVWHQIVIAFLYYAVFQHVSILFVSVSILLTAIFSLLSVMLRKNKYLYGMKKFC